LSRRDSELVDSLQPDQDTTRKQAQTNTYERYTITNISYNTPTNRHNAYVLTV